MRRRASRRSVSSCDSPGPRVPTAAAEALEVLPHAPHARQVVLELRELDLELPLGARRVLGEDVEDQLRPVDHARVERVLEVALLRRGRARRRRAGSRRPLARSAPSAPRACPCRRTCAAPDARDAVRRADRLDAGGAGKLLDLGQLVVRHPRPGPVPRGRSRAPAPEVWERGIIEPIMPAPPRTRARRAHARARRHRRRRRGEKRRSTAT